jgi:general secretion pathway protein F
VAHFHYSAFSAIDGQITGEIEAANKAKVLEILHSRGLLPHFISEAADGAPPVRKQVTLWGRKFTLADYAIVARQLATLAEADLPLDQSLRLLSTQGSSPGVTAFAEALQNDVASGHSLSAALNRQSDGLPAYVVPLVQAGEAQGNIALALSDIATLIERRIELSGQVRNALTYPIVLGVVALGTLGVIIGVLVPTLAPLFRDAGRELPPALAVAEAIGTGLTHYGMIVIPAMIACVGGIFGWARTASPRPFVGRIGMKLPGIGQLIEKTNVSRFARTLGTLLRNGVGLVPALELTSGALNNPTYKRAVKAAAEKVKEGSKLTDALASTNTLPSQVLRFIGIGEEASKIDTMLLHLAVITEKEGQRQLERLMTLLTPAITVTIGIAIGGLILSVMQAILGINEFALK